MRHKQPEFVDAWYRSNKIEPPACCHTCDWYGADGICAEFDDEPPEDFASSIGKCDLWIREIPF